MTRSFEHKGVVYYYILKPRYYITRFKLFLLRVVSKKKARQLLNEAKKDYKEMPLDYLVIIRGERIKIEKDVNDEPKQ